MNTLQITPETKKISPKEVFRSTEVMVIGDLHGNIDALWGNLESLGVIDDEQNWIGGGEKLVFLGDILADRSSDGFEILHSIESLQLQGANITVLVGNHDDFAISFLLNKPVSGNGGTFLNYKEQAFGMIEFEKYMNKEYKNLEKLNREEVLKNMKASEEGQKTLQNICNMKIIEQIDDTIFTHTDITKAMAEMILAFGVDRINSVYQRGVRKVLLEEGSIEDLSEEFFQINDIFLRTGNREYMSNIHGKSLKEIGINHVLHGHSDNGGKRFNIGGVFVASVDHSAFKGGEKIDARSIGVIRTDGNIDLPVTDKDMVGNVMTAIGKAWDRIKESL
ncbi:hypothetical protein COB57_02820 [Candidatus Peregrinibacteria bacterium]|nr:MAG: hypothetical protein COB57_02820 [Candidatus Peregrinibacteria bacterium]